MTKVLTVIPARLGSTRFPKKVLAKLAGRTMIEWCWRAAVSAKLGPVVVAADSKTVADEVRRFGGDVVMTSPDIPSGSDRVWQAAKKRKESVILNFQGDMPLIKPETLRATVRALTTGTDIATAVIPLHDESRSKDPNVVKAVRTVDGTCLYFSRSQVPQGAGPRWEHLGLYVYRRSSLRKFVDLAPSPLERTERLEQLRALEAGMKIKAAVVDERPVSVDVPADLKKAENILRRGNK